MNKGFELLLNSLPFPIWMKNTDLEFIYVNDIYTKLYNKKKVDYIGFKNEDIFDEKTTKKYNSYCIDVINSRRAKNFDAYINNKFYQCCIFPIIDNKGILHAIAGLIGILDKNELEEKNLEIEMQKNLTSQIIDMLPGVIFYKDRESKYVYANEECQKFYKEKGIDNILGKTDLELQENIEIAKKFLEDDKIIIKTKKPIFQESIVEGKHGIKQYRDVVKMPLFDNKGEVRGIVGRSIDVTKIRESEEKLKYLSYTDILTGVKNRTCFEEEILEVSKEENLPLGIIMGDVNGLKLVNDTFGHEDGDRLLKLTTDVLNEVCKEIGNIYRIGGDEFVILIPNANRKICEQIMSIITEKCDKFDDKLFKLSISLGSAIQYSKDIDVFKVLKEAEDNLYRKKILQKGSIKNSVLSSLKMGLGIKSIETEEHTKRVSQYAVKLGKKLELSVSKLDDLVIMGELHDIGKIGISEDILLKPGRLTDEEFEIMKSHSEKGYRIIKASSELENIAKGVLHHHERWDGKGYPIGLKGEEIPLISRIISVVDAYDVMTNGRIYKKAMNKEEAIEELISCSGSQFDPTIVEKFIDCIR